MCIFVYCLCIAHEPGLVSLQVAYGSTVSSSRVFEYKKCRRTKSSVNAMAAVAPGNMSTTGVRKPLISISPASSQGSMRFSLSPEADVMKSGQDEYLPGMGRLSPLSSPFEQFRPPQSPQDTLYSSPGASPGSSLSTLSVDGDTNPSVVDWCEFLGDSRNVLAQDFTDLSLTGTLSC